MPGVWLICVALAVIPEFEVQTADALQSGQLVELSAARLVLRSANGNVTTPTTQLLRIQNKSAPTPIAEAPAVWVETLDGAVFLGRQYQTEADRADFTTLAGQQLSLPVRRVARVRFRAPAAETAAQWKDLIQAPPAGDVLVLRKLNALDHLTGIISKVTPEQVLFESEGEKFDVKRAKLEAILYARPIGVDLPASWGTVVHASGSRVPLTSMAINGETIKITTPAGLTIDWPLASIVTIEFKVQYLSDLKPETIQQTPFVAAGAGPTAAMTRFYRPRFDEAWNHEPLRAGGRQFSKGIAIAAYTELNYRLTEPFATLQAVAAIDPVHADRGRVQLVVLGDDRVLLDTVIAGRELQPVVANLAGVKRLKIIVDFAGNEVGDRLFLGDVRLLK